MSHLCATPQTRGCTQMTSSCCMGWAALHWPFWSSLPCVNLCLVPEKMPRCKSAQMCRCYLPLAIHASACLQLWLRCERAVAGVRCGLTPSALAGIACREGAQKSPLEKLDRRASELAGAAEEDSTDAAYMRNMGALLDELLVDHAEPA